MLVAVDGTAVVQRRRAICVTSPESCIRLGVVTGMAFDAGGSTTIAFDGDVLNSPSDGVRASRLGRADGSLLRRLRDAARERRRVAERRRRGREAAPLVQGRAAVDRDGALVGPGSKVVWKYEGPRESGRYPLEPAAKELVEGKWRFVVERRRRRRQPLPDYAPLHRQRDARLSQALGRQPRGDEEAQRDASRHVRTREPRASG